VSQSLSVSLFSSSPTYAILIKLSASRAVEAVVSGFVAVFYGTVSECELTG